MPHRSERQCRSDIDFYVQQPFLIEKLAAFDWASICSFSVVLVVSRCTPLRTLTALKP